VEHYWHSILAQSYVQLDGVSAKLQGTLKGANRVLWYSIRNAPMGNYLKLAHTVSSLVQW